MICFDVAGAGAGSGADDDDDDDDDDDVVGPGADDNDDVGDGGGVVYAELIVLSTSNKINFFFTSKMSIKE